jgi:putative ABC transport system permease protein
MEAEFRLHVDLETEKNVRLGLTPAEARRRALIAFGSIDAHSEAMRDGRGARWLDDCWVDLRYAARWLARSPSFTLVALSILALGIAASTVLFSVVHTILYRPLPFPDAAQLAVVWTGTNDRSTRAGGWLSAPEVTDVRTQVRGFREVAAVRDWKLNLTSLGEPAELSALAVSANYFRLLGVPALQGRFFTESEDQPGSARVVVVSEGFWRTRLAGRLDVIGQSILLDGDPYTVVGVMPARFRLPPLSSVLPRAVDVWVPFSALVTGTLAEARSVRHVHLIARLEEATTVGTAQQQLDALALTLKSTHPDVYGNENGFRFQVAGVHESLSVPVRAPLLTLFGAVVLLLLTVCANLGGLLLARASARSREVLTRLALGAGRGRLLRQFLTEGLVLGVCGSIAGLLLALIGIAIVRSLRGTSIPRLEEVALSPVAVLFAALTGVVAALLFSSAPAGYVLAGASTRTLQDRGSSARRRESTLRALLVVTQIGLSFALVNAALLLGRSLQHLYDVDPGYDASNVLTARVSLPPAKYATGSARVVFFNRLVDGLPSHPGVLSAGAITQLPLSGAYLASPFRARGSQAANADRFSADLRGVTTGYFDAMNMAVVRGRAFTVADDSAAEPVAIVDETLARRFWPGEDAVGKVLVWLRADLPVRIVGVVRHVRHYGMQSEGKEQVYRPYAQYRTMSTMTVALRVQDHPSAFAGLLRQQIESLDPGQPVTDLRPMNDLVDASLDRPRFSAVLAVSFATFALLLSLIGLNGLISYSVTQRQREFAIRSALGAEQRELLRLVMRQAGLLLAKGLGLGLLLAFVVGRFLEGLIYGVQPTSLSVYALAGGALTVAALLAAAPPARRAAHTAPAVLLRGD